MEEFKKDVYRVGKRLKLLMNRGNNLLNNHYNDLHKVMAENPNLMEICQGNINLLNIHYNRLATLMTENSTATDKELWDLYKKIPSFEYKSELKSILGYLEDLIYQYEKFVLPLIDEDKNQKLDN